MLDVFARANGNNRAGVPWNRYYRSSLFRTALFSRYIRHSIARYDRSRDISGIRGNVCKRTSEIREKIASRDSEYDIDGTPV